MATDHERLERARKAQELMEDEVLTEAFDLLEQRYLQELRDTKLTQEQERTQLWHRLKVLEHIRRELQAMVEDGYVVRLNLEKTRKLKMWS